MDKFSFKDIRDEFTEEIRNKSTAADQSHSDTLVEPPGCVLNKKFASRLKRIQDFEVFPDDTWVLSFPKCGTTWTQEMVWLLKNKVDFSAAKSTRLRDRFPFLELESIMDTIVDTNTFPDTLAKCANLPRPRCIKSHLPPELLPSQFWTVKPKAVYVTRNPQDAVVSYYHHHRLWNGYTGTLEDFFSAFIADRVVYAPYWSHVKSYWALREEENVLFNTFEEMKKDLPAVVRRTAEFLGTTITDEEVSRLCDHLSFASMKDNESVNLMDAGRHIKQQTNINDPQLSFIRSGETGGWRKEFTPDMIDRMNSWTKAHLENSELSAYPCTT